MQYTKLLMAGALALALHAAPASATDASVTLTPGVVTQVLRPPVRARYYERIINIQPFAAPNIAWCSRTDQNPAAYKPGSYPIVSFFAYSPIYMEVFSSAGPGTLNGFVPQMPLWCTADGGNVALTVEYYEAVN